MNGSIGSATSSRLMTGAAEDAIALKVPRLSREEHEASVETVRQNFPETTEHKPYRSPA
jgi:hypothetical protein